MRKTAQWKTVGALAIISLRTVMIMNSRDHSRHINQEQSMILSSELLSLVKGRSGKQLAVRQAICSAAGFQPIISITEILHVSKTCQKYVCIQLSSASRVEA